MEYRAKQYALKLLSYRGRSVKELQQKLRKKGFPETVVSSTLHFLEHTGLINDRALAETLKQEAMSTKFLSQNATRRFMLNRGIPKDIVDSMSIYDEEEDFKNAMRLIEKKLKALKNYPAEKKKRRLYNLLLRRGYSFDTIRSALIENNSREE